MTAPALEEAGEFETAQKILDKEEEKKK